MSERAKKLDLFSLGQKATKVEDGKNRNACFSM